jgi:hypothetical protein
MAAMSKTHSQEGHVSNPEQNASVKAPAFSRIAPAALSSVSSETSKTRTAESVISFVSPFMALIPLFISVDDVTGNPEIYSPPGSNQREHKLVSAGNIPLARD